MPSLLPPAIHRYPDAMNALPVICIGFTHQFFHVITQLGASIVKVVTIHIKAPPYTCRITLCAIIGIGLKDTVDDTLLCGSRGARFIIIVHKVISSAFSGISSVGGAPVIEYIVAQIGKFLFPSSYGAAAIQTRSAATVMSQQIMVETCSFTSPNRSISVVSFDVYRFG